MVLVEKDVISTPLLVIDNRTDFSKYLKLMFIHLIIPPNTFDFNYTLKKLIIEVPNKHRVVVEFKPKMILPHNMYVQLLFKEYLDVNYAREIVESIYKEYHKKLNITFKQVVDLSLNSVYVYIFADWFRSIPIEYGIMYKNVLEGSFLNLISYVKQKYRIVLNRTINLRFNITPVFMDPLSHIRYVTIDLNNTYSIIDYENKCFRALSFIIKTSYKNTFINIGVKMNNAIYLFSYNYYKWIPSMLLKLDRYALYYKEMENTIFYILDSSNILRNFGNSFNSIIFRYSLIYEVPEHYGRTFIINDNITILVIEYLMPLVKIEVEDEYGKVHEIYGSMLINGGDRKLISDILSSLKD